MRFVKLANEAAVQQANALFESVAAVRRASWRCSLFLYEYREIEGRPFMHKQIGH